MDYQNYIDKHIDSLNKKTIIITGANSGIGFSLAKQCTYLNADVYLACRNSEKAANAIKDIKQLFPKGNVSFLKYDQANLASIDEFAKSLQLFNHIDCLVLNAGIFKPGKNLKTIDGFPLTTGTNYIGEFYLLNKLDKLIKQNKISQIVIVTSLIRHFAPRDYLSYLNDDRNKLTNAYSSSKRMNFELAEYLHSTYKDLNVKVIHPGIANTQIVNNELNSFSKFIIPIGNFVLKLIANTSDKSSLCFLKAISDKSYDLNYYYPRRIFHTAGLPACRKIKNYQNKSSKLIAASNKLLNF